MKKYLATIHTRSDRHKTSFALGVSGGFTLLIFAVWFIAREPAAPIAKKEGPSQLAGVVHEVSPLESLAATAANAWDGILASFHLFNQGIENINLDESYKELKNESIGSYGR